MKIKHRINAIVYKMLPQKKYLEIRYKLYFKEKLNINNPQKFTEKLYWLKVYNGKFLKEIIQLCYDKYTVRKYLESKGCEEYLNELYGVYNNADEIDFNALPNSFVLKITQSCGYNIICPSKDLIDISKVKKQLNTWLFETNRNTKKEQSEEDYVFTGNAKIVCEKYLENSEGKIPNDIRFFCFNGTVRLIVCDVGTTNENGLHGTDIKRYTFTENWELIPVDFGRQAGSKLEAATKPKKLREMISIAETLSQEFPFVRVDLFEVDSKIIFGELTWIPMGGNVKINPREYDLGFGEMLQLPEVNIY